MTKRYSARGKYYATAIEVRANGQKYGRQVARQAQTLSAACRALEGSGQRGYVQRWSDQEQQRSIVAELDEAGNWWTLDPFRGILLALDPHA